jgi:hypothetical protein
LDTKFPGEAVHAARSLIKGSGSSVEIGGGLKRDTADLGSGDDAVNIELDAETAKTIVGGLNALENWLANGEWVTRHPDGPPRLLSMIEEAAAEAIQGQWSTPLVGELIERYRDLMEWGASFVEQRPIDQADRDELVLLTAVRIQLLEQPQMPQNPVMARTLLSEPYGRLSENWGDDTAVGVNAYSRGHFGNDQDLFNDVCRAMAVDLLDRAVGKGDGRTVYLATSIFDRSTGRLRAELDQKIGECLEAGWRVVQILDRSNVSDNGRPDARVQADFATHMVVDLETKGVYVPIRLAPANSTDMVLVEGVGALVFPSVGHSSVERVRPGKVPSPAMAIRCITGRGGRGDGPAATPIMTELRVEARALYGTAATQTYMDKRQLPFGYRIPTDNLLWFDRQLTASELLEGDRYSMKPVLPTSTLPDELTVVQFDEWRQQLLRLMEGEADPDGLTVGWSTEVIDQCTGYLRRVGWDEIDQALKRLQNKRNVRHFGFETNTAHNRYRDCVLKSQIVRYMSEEDPWYYPNPLYGPGGLDLEQRRVHMVYLANELENTRLHAANDERIGYTLGLIDDEVGQPYDLLRTWWLATRSSDGRADQVHYLHNPAGRAATYVATLKEDSLEEFDAVDTFVSLFDGVWYTIKPEDRSPASVIDFILDQLPKGLRSDFKRKKK